MTKKCIIQKKKIRIPFCGGSSSPSPLLSLIITRNTCNTTETQTLANPKTCKSGRCAEKKVCIIGVYIKITDSNSCHFVPNTLDQGANTGRI